MKNMLILISLLLCDISHASDAVLFGTPAELAHIEGNSALAPYGGLLPSRFQQVYAATDFLNALPPGGGWISDLVFRTDGPLGQSFHVILSGVQITLSTTPRLPDGLSTTFADNFGSDVTTVFSGPVELQGFHAPPFNIPQSLAASIHLTQPFYYNPANGNLLLDIQSIGGPVTSAMDATDTFGDSVSSVFAYGGDLTSGVADSRGAFTFFAIQAVPEPSVISLLAAGVIGLAIVGWRKRRERK